MVDFNSAWSGNTKLEQLQHLPVVSERTNQQSGSRVIRFELLDGLILEHNTDGQITYLKGSLRKAYFGKCYPFDLNKTQYVEMLNRIDSVLKHAFCENAYLSALELGFTLEVSNTAATLERLGKAPYVGAFEYANHTHYATRKQDDPTKSSSVFKVYDKAKEITQRGDCECSQQLVRFEHRHKKDIKGKLGLQHKPTLRDLATHWEPIATKNRGNLSRITFRPSYNYLRSLHPKEFELLDSVEKRGGLEQWHEAKKASGFSSKTVTRHKQNAACLLATDDLLEAVRIEFSELLERAYLLTLE